MACHLNTYVYENTYKHLDPGVMYMESILIQNNAI